VRWLLEHQNEDGGWGEDARSYDEPEWVGRGPSTASQTGWALLALLAVAETPVCVTEELRSAIDRGVLYLTETQRADGT
jgi:squalene-hopene/tetraprenyl-beta-curcumene cyclase